MFHLVFLRDDFGFVLARMGFTSCGHLLGGARDVSANLLGQVSFRPLRPDCQKVLIAGAVGVGAIDSSRAHRSWRQSSRHEKFVSELSRAYG